MNNVYGEKKYWILTLYFYEGSNTRRITTGHKVFDGYYLPRVHRWLFNTREDMNKGAKLLREVEINSRHREDFKKFITETDVVAIKSLVDQYI